MGSSQTYGGNSLYASDANTRDIYLKTLWDEVLNGVDYNEKGELTDEDFKDVLDACPDNIPLARDIKQALVSEPLSPQRSELVAAMRKHVSQRSFADEDSFTKNLAWLKDLKVRTEMKKLGRIEEMRGLHVELFNILDFKGNGYLIVDDLQRLTAMMDDQLKIKQMITHDFSMQSKVSLSDFMDQYFKSIIKNGPPKGHEIMQVRRELDTVEAILNDQSGRKTPHERLTWCCRVANPVF
eukprot:1383718-Amorphochlora_amoeboformis.AAC.1